MWIFCSHITRFSNISNNTLWFKKNAPTSGDYNYAPIQSILIIFSKLFVNDHKSCLVVKFSTSPHIFCHYTLWNTMLYFALITLLIGKNAPSLVSQAHRPPDLCPPNSPDLKPFDYRIWGLMQQRLYKTPVRDTIDLKKRLVDTWASIPQCVVDEAVDQWTVRLRACVKAKGRQFEHLLQ